MSTKIRLSYQYVPVATPIACPLPSPLLLTPPSCIYRGPRATFNRQGVTDLITRIVQVLGEDLYWIRISAQEAGLMEPVELWDEG